MAAPPVAALDSEALLETTAPTSILPSPALELTSPALELTSPALELTSPALELTSPAPPPSEWPDAGIDAALDSLGPSQMDALPADSIPAFRDHGPRRAFLAIGGLASAGLIWFIVSSSSFAPSATTELPRVRPAAAASPAPVAVPAPAAPSPTEVTPPPERETTAPSAASNAPNTIPVAVHISPPDAFVFESGRRLGRGDVTVDVTPGTKITLVAQLRGYSARTVVLDGSYTSVNIALRRARASRTVTPASPEKPVDSASTSSVTPTESAPTGVVGDPSNPPASADATPPAPVGEIAPL